MKNVEKARYFNFWVSLIIILKISTCFVINSNGIKIINDQNILCIKTSSGSTLDTCLK